jgi:hypothetical protein
MQCHWKRPFCPGSVSLLNVSNVECCQGASSLSCSFLYYLNILQLHLITSPLETMNRIFTVINFHLTKIIMKSKSFYPRWTLGFPRAVMPFLYAMPLKTSILSRFSQPFKCFQCWVLPRCIKSVLLILVLPKHSSTSFDNLIHWCIQLGGPSQAFLCISLFFCWLFSVHNVPDPVRWYSRLAQLVCVA